MSRASSPSSVVPPRAMTLARLGLALMVASSGLASGCGSSHGEAPAPGAAGTSGVGASTAGGGGRNGAGGATAGKTASGGAPTSGAAGMLGGAPGVAGTSANTGGAGAAAGNAGRGGSPSVGGEGGSGGRAGEAGQSAVAGDAGSAGSAGAGASSGDRYGACNTPSDCPVPDSTCSTKYGCMPPCDNVSNPCQAPADGSTAIADCALGYCVLSCLAGVQTCPNDLTCDDNSDFCVVP
jgi:hypothetical protein